MYFFQQLSFQNVHAMNMDLVIPSVILKDIASARIMLLETAVTIVPLDSLISLLVKV